MFKRTSVLAVDIILNGLFLYGVFLAASFIFYSVLPTSVFFNYTAVDPVSVPVSIGSNYILMESQMEVSISGNLSWHDVLSCKLDGENFTYFSQQDTKALMVYEDSPFAKQWLYRGPLPDFETTCQMESTIIRELPMGVEKVQHIVSEPFDFKFKQ